jgi:hypothetical protein
MIVVARQERNGALTGDAALAPLAALAARLP